MSAIDDCDQITYRLALLTSEDDGLLLERHTSGLTLPRITIPKFARPAREIQKAVYAQWNQTVLALDFISDPSPGLLCVAEVLTRDPNRGLILTRVDQIDTSELNTKERIAIENVRNGCGNGRDPFARIGWIQKAMHRICEVTGDTLLYPSGIEQFNGGGSFALLRLRTSSGQTYWLKATGDPNRHEFSITTVLSQIAPYSLPQLITSFPDWNAWVMKDAGEPLSLGKTTPERVAVTLGELQKKTIGQTHKLLDAGAADQRSHVLREYVSELIPYLEEAMGNQSSSRVPRIDSVRLKELGRILDDALSLMSELSIPDTIGHNDLNPTNILAQNGHFIFTDWCEAYVGNPFFTFEHLLQVFYRNMNYSGTFARRLTEIYRHCWLDYLAEWQIEQAFIFAPLAAIASYLIGRGDWLRSERRNEPQIQSYARSLARQMDRAAAGISPKEVLCH